MAAELRESPIQSLVTENEIYIGAPLDLAFEALLEEIGPANAAPDGTPMPMILEAWPGGRWFRDQGKQSGHLWGHVQVIKPPTLLEIAGPLFMSYPVINHVQYRLVAEGHGVRLKHVHRGFGEFTPGHREGVQAGWRSLIDRIKGHAESRRPKA